MRFGAEVADVPVIRRREGPFEADVMELAEDVHLTGEQDGRVDSGGVHVPQADRRVPVACLVDHTSARDHAAYGRPDLAGSGDRRAAVERVDDSQRSQRRVRVEGVEPHFPRRRLPGLYGFAEPFVHVSVFRVYVVLERPVQVPVLAYVRVRVDDQVPVIAHRASLLWTPGAPAA